MPELERSFRGWPKKCVTCKYRADGYGTKGTCDYLTMTGHARILVSPEAGKNCTAWEKRERGQRKRREPILPTVRKKRKNPLHDQMMELYQKGMSDVAIGKEIGRSKSCVRHWRISLNLPAYPSGEPRKARGVMNEDALRVLYAEGKTDEEMALALNLAEDTVMRWRCREKLKKNKGDTK